MTGKTGILSVGPKCFVEDRAAADQLAVIWEEIDQTRIQRFEGETDISHTHGPEADLGCAIDALVRLQDSEPEQLNFQQAAHGDALEKRIAEAIRIAKYKRAQAKNEIEAARKSAEGQQRHEEERLRIERERRSAEEKEQAERAAREARQATEDVTRSAEILVVERVLAALTPELATAGQGAGVGNYTGCREYGGNYAMTSTDD